MSASDLMKCCKECVTATWCKKADACLNCYSPEDSHIVERLLRPATARGGSMTFPDGKERRQVSEQPSFVEIDAIRARDAEWSGTGITGPLFDAQCDRRTLLSALDSARKAGLEEAAYFCEARAIDYDKIRSRRHKQDPWWVRAEELRECAAAIRAKAVDRG